MSDTERGYTAAGVDTGAASNALGRLAASVNKTLGLRGGRPGRPIRGLGYYANVLDLGGGLGLAVSTDGVGTKLLVAEMMDRYDTVGIDCVAMNVNDLICVGAEPIAMLDYVAVGKADPGVFEEVGKGLLLACEKCRISIPGGETAMVREMLRGIGAERGLRSRRDGGRARPARSRDVRPGRRPRRRDRRRGVSGLHSNGFSLARRCCSRAARPSRPSSPRSSARSARRCSSRRPCTSRLPSSSSSAGVPVHALSHITGDGYMNLARVEAKVGFVLDAFPEWPAVFSVIAEKGGLRPAEMYTVFNMGIGLCVMVPESHAATVIDAAKRHGFAARRLGDVTSEIGDRADPAVEPRGAGAKGRRAASLRSGDTSYFGRFRVVCAQRGGTRRLLRALGVSRA